MFKKLLNMGGPGAGLGTVSPLPLEIPAGTKAKLTPEAPPPPGPGDLLGLLVNALSEPVGPEFREDQSELLGETLELKEAVERHFGKIRGARRQTLEGQQRELAAACRRQQFVVAALETEVGGLFSQFNECIRKSAKALLEFRASQDSIPSPDVWPTDSELRTANERVKEARVAFGLAKEQEKGVMDAYNAASAKLGEARSEFARLRNEEKAARNRLSGKPYLDAETGLQVTPTV
jgi:hypothetical protein